MNFGPDLSDLSPDLLVSLSQLVPNADKSWRCPYATQTSSYAAFSTSASFVPVIGAFFATKKAGSNRLFAGTATKLYEANTVGLSWTDVSAGAGTYTTTDRWHFCQYGDQTIAANKANTIQQSSSGAFAALAGAPKALCVETLSDALLAWNVNDGTDKPDWLFITDAGVITAWTPATGSTAYKTQLTDCPGPGTAMIRFRDFVVIFKQRGMWIAQPSFDTALLWDVRLYSADVGCAGKDACIVAGDILYFMDDADVYAFDGAQIRSIVAPQARKNIINSLRGVTAAGGSLEFVAAQHDDMTQCISFYGGASSTKTLAWIYNRLSGEWGHQYAANSDGASPGSNPTKAVMAVFTAPAKSIKLFTGAPAFTNECRPCFAFEVSGINFVMSFQNGHGAAQMGRAGSAVTAWFGSPFKAQTLTRLYLNSDSNTGITVTVQTKRAPNSSATTQSSTSSASFNADMIADMIASGHFFKITWAFATTAAFTAWLDYAREMVQAGKN